MRLTARTIVAVVTASVTLGAVPAARAGTYTVYGCQTPTGLRAPMDSWQVAVDDANGNTSDHWIDTCPAPVYLQMAAGVSHPDGDYAQETFIAPTDTTIRSYTLWRGLRLQPSAGFLYQALDRSAGQWRLVDGCTAAATCGVYGNVGTPSSPSNVFRHTAETGTTEVALMLLCSRSGGCPEVWSDGHRSDSIWLFHSAMTLEDDFAPQFAAPPSGPLVAPGATLAGVVPVSVAATDRGSGVYEAMVEVDGHVLQSQVLNPDGGLCQPPFVVAVPCQLSTGGTIDFDTGQLADGSHSLRLLVSDAAGNLTAWGPITITTVNNPCSPVPATGGMRLQAALAVDVRRRVRIHKRLRVITRVHLVDHVTSSRRRLPALGSLTTAAGQPVAGAPVCVAVRDNYAGAPLRETAALTTNGAGGFSARLAPGPSRTVFFIHRLPGGAVSDALQITTRVPVSVHVSGHKLTNGHVMTWTGRLPGPRPRGLLGLMQVWRGRYWQTFQQVAIAGNGTWRGRYRFQFTTGVQHYKFRFLVPRQDGYPYAVNASPPIRVIVTG